MARDKAERRPGAGEEWLAATKHDGVEVFMQASCNVSLLMIC
jgi:hypothetical protein